LHSVAIIRASYTKESNESIGQRVCLCHRVVATTMAYAYHRTAWPLVLLQGSLGRLRDSAAAARTVCMTPCTMAAIISSASAGHWSTRTCSRCSAVRMHDLRINRSIRTSKRHTFSALLHYCSSLSRYETFLLLVTQPCLGDAAVGCIVAAVARCVSRGYVVCVSRRSPEIQEHESARDGLCVCVFVFVWHAVCPS